MERKWDQKANLCFVNQGEVVESRCNKRVVLPVNLSPDFDGAFVKWFGFYIFPLKTEILLNNGAGLWRKMDKKSNLLFQR